MRIRSLYRGFNTFVTWLVSSAIVLMPLTYVPAAYAAADTGVDEIHSDFGDTPGTTMWIHWRGPAAEVNYGTTTSYGSTSASSVTLPTTLGTVKVPVPIDPSAAGKTFERVQLTGLTAGTVYHYRISATGLDHTFKSAPTGDFTWDDIGDTSTTYDYTGNGSNPKCNNPYMTSVWSQIAAEAPDFVTHGGDINYANVCGWPAIHQYYQDYAPIATTRAVEQVWGNHEDGLVDSGAPQYVTGTTVYDSLANYKSRSYTPNPQVLSTDGQFLVANEGCPGDGTVVPVAQNGCQGADWGSFTVGKVLFISTPEPWVSGYADWQAGAGALMAAAQNNANINFIVTLSHRPIYSSINGGIDTTNTQLADAINALAAQYSNNAITGGKYVMNIAHHVHGEELVAPSATSPIFNVTNGGGGTEEAKYGSPIAGSIFRSEHLGHLKVTVTGSSMDVKFICGPDDVNTTQGNSDCVTGQGYVLADQVITTTPYVPVPGASICTTGIPTNNQVVANTSLEPGQGGQVPWDGVYNSSSKNTLVTSINGADACDGYSSDQITVKTGVPAQIGLNATTAPVTNSTAGVIYTGKVYVKGGVAGKAIHLQLFEKTSTTTTSLANVTVTPANTTTWYPITAVGTAANNGSSILFKVFMDTTAATDSFFADGFSMVQSPGLPPITPQNTCPDVHTGDFITNRSVENDGTGWNGVVSAQSLVVDDNQDACVGSWSLKTTLDPGQTATLMGFNSKPSWVTSSTVNSTYTGKVWVKAGAAGKTMKLRMQETDGTTVYGDRTATVTSTGGWDLITNTLVATTAGNQINFKVFMDSPLSTDVFHADNMSLTAVAGPPPVTNQTLCSDTTNPNEQVTNRSVEGDLNGWDNVGSSTSLVWDNTAACDGLRSVKVANQTSHSLSMLGLDSSNDPWVSSTTVGATYTGSLWLKASVAGTAFTIRTQEGNGTGNVGKSELPYTAADTAWHKVTAPVYTSLGNGNYVNFMAFESAAAVGQYFNADNMSLISSVPVISPPSSVCTDSPTGTQTVTNRSVETNITGWDSIYNAASNVAQTGSVWAAACDGSYAEYVTNNSGASSAIGFQNKSPYWVNNSTVAFRLYNLRVWVRAPAGKTLHLGFTEKDATTTYNSGSTPYTTVNTGWHLMQLGVVAQGSGHSIQMRVFEDAASTTDYLLADNMSLTY